MILTNVVDVEACTQNSLVHSVTLSFKPRF